MTLIQAVNDHARRLGYAAGYPTFQQTQGAEGRRYQAVLLRGEDVRATTVSLDEFSDAATNLQTDGIHDSLLVTSLMHAVNRWAVARGYPAALPSYYTVNPADEALNFEAMLLTKSVKRDTIPTASLGDLTDVPAVFLKTHAWGVKSGNLSAFPTFRLRGTKMDCVLIRSKFASVVEIPEAELRLPVK